MRIIREPLRYNRNKTLFLQLRNIFFEANIPLYNCCKKREIYLYCLCVRRILKRFLVVVCCLYKSHEKMTRLQVFCFLTAIHMSTADKLFPLSVWPTFCHRWFIHDIYIIYTYIQSRFSLELMDALQW